MTTSKSEKKVAVRVVASGEKLLISSNFHFCDNCTLNIDKNIHPDQMSITLAIRVFEGEKVASLGF